MRGSLILLVHIVVQYLSRTATCSPALTDHHCHISLIQKAVISGDARYTKCGAIVHCFIVTVHFYFFCDVTQGSLSLGISNIIYYFKYKDCMFFYSLTSVLFSSPAYNISWWYMIVHNFNDVRENQILIITCGRTSCAVLRHVRSYVTCDRT